MEAKRCKRCHEVKPLKDFRVDERKKNGHYATCRMCVINLADMRRSTRPPTISKTCKTCGEEKAGEAFGVDRSTKDGLRASCKACLKQQGCHYYRGWTEERRAQAREYSRQWRINNPVAYKKAYIKSMRKRKYGVDEDTYQRMLEEQGHRCAICGHEEKLKSNGVDVDNLSVDHNHRTGAIRGLLCHNCNRALGLLADDPQRLAAAIVYLRQLR